MFSRLAVLQSTGPVSFFLARLTFFRLAPIVVFPATWYWHFVVFFFLSIVPVARNGTPRMGAGPLIPRRPLLEY